MQGVAGSNPAGRTMNIKIIYEDKNIVAIDPGKCDLLFCVDSSDAEANQYRYSQDRRRKETKSKKYGKILLEQKRLDLLHLEDASQGQRHQAHKTK